jgi:hypothetical protein
VEASGATEIVIDSEKQRFIDVPYSVSFTNLDGEEVTARNQVTIVNASIPTNPLATTEDLETETNREPEPEPAPEVAGETTSNVPTTPVVAGPPQVVQEVIYALPTSDPNGSVDLAIRLVTTGVMTSQNFIPGSLISKSQTGAFQFEVKNLGTKTSDNWSFAALLPSDIKYTSKTQSPLKPNERAIITLGFDGITKTGVEAFSAQLTTDEDTDASNNQFASTVRITQ